MKLASNESSARADGEPSRSDSAIEALGLRQAAGGPPGRLTPTEDLACGASCTATAHPASLANTVRNWSKGGEAPGGSAFAPTRRGVLAQREHEDAPGPGITRRRTPLELLVSRARCLADTERAVRL